MISILAKRYAAHPFGLIRSAIADRAVTVEREFKFTSVQSDSATAKPHQRYLQLPPGRDRSILIAEKIIGLAKDGGVLCILPDEREVDSLGKALSHLGSDYLKYDSTLSKSDRYRNFLKVRTGEAEILIGTRSAIFAPMPGLASIIIYNENSEHLYERRSPGWNVRDVAQVRANVEKCSLFFIGYSPSTDLAHLIEQGAFEYKKSRAKVKVSVVPQIHGELLPSRALQPIKSALKSGPVLFLSPLKGYAQAIRCAKCATISRCECGGAHQQKSEKSPIECSHCLTKVTQWQCVWCHALRPALLARGVDRHQHEVGILFPGAQVSVSSSDHPILESVSTGIVLATPGMAPAATTGYSAVVILEGNRFLNQPDLRSQERIRELYFAHAALARDGAPIILIQDNGHHIATALTTWNPITAISRELEERRNLGLPPFVKSASLAMEQSEIVKLSNALHVAQEEGRIPASTKILGPIPSGEKSALIITSAIADGEQLVKTLHEFMRRRSAAKKSMPTLRIDPYSLSH